MMKMPTWRSNLAIFVVIFATVVGYFFWQQDLALQQIRQQAQEYSRILATVVQRNIKNALVSNRGLETVITGFLENSARFVSYLNGIEKFSSSELSAFARESGLAGVTIIPADGSARVSGPSGWLPEDFFCSSAGLVSLPKRHLYLFGLADEAATRGEKGCVIVGLATGEIENLQQEVSVERLLQVLTDLHGIAYVRLESAAKGHEAQAKSSTTFLTRENNRVLSKTIFPMGTRRLVVALDASHFSKRLKQMRIQFGLFIAFLVFGGTVSTWWLFRMQRLRLDQAREFERTLARQHEEAALGRAAETITHEMRNPLNAINMGLQRLQIEAGNLEPDHRQLIVSMREAITRSDSIISSLQQYTHSFELAREPLVLAEPIVEVVTLYKALCDRQSIRVELDLDRTLVVDGDRVLLGQLFENVIKNGVEAQPDGGFLKIVLAGLDEYCEVLVTTTGCVLSEDDINHIFEPYFTTKSKGTGLGLAIGRKIALAHLGSCWCRLEKGEFSFHIRLPMRPA